MIKIIKALLSASVLLVFSFSHSLAAPPGAHLDVTQMFVDDPNKPTSIVIIGMGLDFGSGPLSVTLGEFGAITVTGTPSDILIDANVSVGIFEGLDQVPKSAVSRHVRFKKAGLTAIGAATYFENTKNQIPEDEL